jgi:hypothetical protein
MKSYLETDSQSEYIPDIGVFHNLEISKIEKKLADQTKEISRQGQHLESLAQGFREVVDVLQEQQKSISTQAIEEINQNVDTLGKATISIYKYMEKVTSSKESIIIKSEQQALRKSVEAIHKILNTEANKPNKNLNFNWNNVIIVIVITAMISSLCSLLIAKFFWSNQSRNTELVKPTVKKY